ncbi:DNA-binding response regulator [Candidatus Parcubacteria bacterium]|nr:MAG: DNA-binding response regulator [Candidatus Parcubacteria bacterium]
MVSASTKLTASERVRPHRNIENTTSKKKVAGKVYIIDDHPAIRYALRCLLESNNFKVLGEAEDLSAIIDIKGIRENADVIILDLNLRTTKGLETIEHARKMFPNTDIVVYSMRKGIRIIGEAYRMGVKAFLTKDESNTEDVIIAVGKVLHGESYTMPHVADKVVHYLAHPEDRKINPIARLTPMERKILAALRENKQPKEIAKELNTSLATVRSRISSLKRKLGVTRHRIYKDLVDILLEENESDY